MFGLSLGFDRLCEFLPVMCANANADSPKGGRMGV